MYKSTEKLANNTAIINMNGMIYTVYNINYFDMTNEKLFEDIYLYGEIDHYKLQTGHCITVEFAAAKYV